MRRRLWLGLAWLLLARAPGAAGTPNRPRGARSYPHLEGDVRWRRLFSSTRFFLRVDAGGRVQGTRWRHGPDSIVEIRSVHVGVVVVKSVHNGFYVAMDRQGRVYGSVSPQRSWAGRGPRSSGPPSWPTPHRGSTRATAGSGSASRRTATTPTRRGTGATTGAPCSWPWTAGASPGAAAGRGGTSCPPTSCPSWCPEAARGPLTDMGPYLDGGSGRFLLVRACCGFPVSLQPRVLGPEQVQEGLAPGG
ncbi:fibroblast growth factor 22 isoform X1 [Choloepus didactylus]|uniref:fibroblast growth factor 22 isoform X1 n=1 Tax=Choloepus didactylus TaxID=27675 RepID=UPI0018A0CC03|nr:fibroblast growth factor 22 isoform X1 [Choloepus didactylus]